MTTTAQQEAITVAVACVLDGVKAAGPTGAPSSVIYSALQKYGMSLATYQSVIAAMQRVNLITVGDDQVIRFPQLQTE